VRRGRRSSASAESCRLRAKAELRDGRNGGVSDIFKGFATADSLRLKAKGDIVEAGNYDLASTLAKQNEKFTEQSTAVKQLMAQRQEYLGIGQERTEIAGAGFTESGSALDLLRSSASQGAMQKQLIGQQGLITEAGYTEQATAYTNLASYAREAADKENSMAGTAGIMGGITGGLKIAAGIASLFTGLPTAPTWDSTNTFLQQQPTDI
jgi:hypothetical protein